MAGGADHDNAADRPSVTSPVERPVSRRGTLVAWLPVSSTLGRWGRRSPPLCDGETVWCSAGRSHGDSATGGRCRHDRSGLAGGDGRTRRSHRLDLSSGSCRGNGRGGCRSPIRRHLCGLQRRRADDGATPRGTLRALRRRRDHRSTGRDFRHDQALPVRSRRRGSVPSLDDASPRRPHRRRRCRCGLRREVLLRRVDEGQRRARFSPCARWPAPRVSRNHSCRSGRCRSRSRRTVSPRRNGQRPEGLAFRRRNARDQHEPRRCRTTRLASVRPQPRCTNGSPSCGTTHTQTLPRRSSTSFSPPRGASRCTCRSLTRHRSAGRCGDVVTVEQQPPIGKRVQTARG